MALFEKLRPCKVCGKEVAQNAKACPHCGAKNPYPTKASEFAIGCMTMILIGWGLLALVDTDAPKESKKEPGKKAESVAKRQPPKPVRVAFIIDAEQLMAEFVTNEVSADSRFTGKYVQVSGQVKQISKGLFGDSFVTLETADSFRLVQCSFRKGHESALGRLRPGVRVTLTGKVSGLLGNVLLKDCHELSRQ